MFEKYRDKGVAFVSVNVSWDTESAAKNFVENNHLTFPVGRDGDARIAGLYGVESTPTTFFIDKDGKLVERVEGAPDDVIAIRDAIDRRLEKLLAG
jgi:peroxiredoxin